MCRHREADLQRELDGYAVTVLTRKIRGRKVSAVALLFVLTSVSGCAHINEMCPTPRDEFCRAGMAAMLVGLAALTLAPVIMASESDSDSPCKPIVATHPSTAFLYGHGSAPQGSGNSQCESIRKHIANKELFYAIHRNDRIADFLAKRSTDKKAHNCLNEDIVPTLGDMADTARIFEYYDPEKGEFYFDHLTDRELQDLLSHRYPVSRRTGSTQSTRPSMETKWKFDQKNSSWNCAIFGWNKKGQKVQINSPGKYSAPPDFSLNNDDVQQNFDDVKSSWKSDILFEAAWIHEMRHMDQCRAFKGLGSIRDTLQLEVQAYADEIGYLREQERLRCR